MIKCPRTLVKHFQKLAIEEKTHNMLLGTFALQAIVSHTGCSPLRGHYKSSVKYDNILYTTNGLNYSIGVEVQYKSCWWGTLPADI